MPTQLNRDLRYLTTATFVVKPNKLKQTSTHKIHATGTIVSPVKAYHADLSSIFMNHLPHMARTAMCAPERKSRDGAHMNWMTSHSRPQRSTYHSFFEDENIPPPPDPCWDDVEHNEPYDYVNSSHFLVESSCGLEYDGSGVIINEDCTAESPAHHTRKVFGPLTTLYSSSGTHSTTKSSLCYSTISGKLRCSCKLNATATALSGHQGRVTIDSKSARHVVPDTSILHVPRRPEYEGSAAAADGLRAKYYASNCDEDNFE